MNTRYRDGIHVGGGKSGNRVGSSGAGGNQAHAGSARGSSVAVCRVDCGLFVADKYELKIVRKVAYQGVEDIDDRTSGVSEDCGHSFLFQGS